MWRLKRDEAGGAAEEHGQQVGPSVDCESTEDQTASLREDLDRGFDQAIDQGAVLHADDGLCAVRIDRKEQEAEPDLEVPGERTDHHVRPVSVETDGRPPGSANAALELLDDVFLVAAIVRQANDFLGADGIGIKIGDVEEVADCAWSGPRGKGFNASQSWAQTIRNE